MKSFLIVYNVAAATEMINAIDTVAKDGNWLHIWPGAVIVQDKVTLDTITDFLHRVLPAAHFMVTEIALNTLTKGWMQASVWDFVSKRK